jgi:hypothetical protein
MTGTTSTVQCVSCVLFTLRDHAGMAQQGLGRCAAMADRPGTFVSPQYPRRCRDHSPTTAAKTAARIDWLRDLRGEGG